MTIEQLEREKASCYGRYDESTNSYEELCEIPEYEKCEVCGCYYEPEEIQEIDGIRYCQNCKTSWLDDEEFNCDDEFSAIDSGIEIIDSIIEKMKKAS